MSELEQALWQAFDGSLAVSGVAKHANHDQKSHGNWAKDRPQLTGAAAQAARKAALESLLSDVERITLFTSRRTADNKMPQGTDLVERVTAMLAASRLGVRATTVKLAVVGKSLSYLDEANIPYATLTLEKLQSLRDELFEAKKRGDILTLDDMRMADFPSAELEIARVTAEFDRVIRSSKMLAESGIDYDLLETPPPYNKMTAWADSLAASPDGGAAFVAAVRELQVGQGVSGSPDSPVKVAAGELLSAHIRKATSGGVEEKLDPRVGSSPEAYQQEQPYRELEFKDSLFDLLPPSTAKNIGNIMDEAIGTASAGSWQKKLYDSDVAGIAKHSVNGRIAERMYAQEEAVSGIGSLHSERLAGLYRYADDQTRSWAQSAASRESALLQQVVADIVDRPESFDSFAERQNHTRMSENRFTALTAQYAQAVYAETQALLGIKPENRTVRAARGTMLYRDTEFELPVKVVEAAILERSGTQRTRLRDSSWEVSTDTIGRQPLSSWATNTQVAHQFANLNPNNNGEVPNIGGFHLVQRAEVPASQIFSTALTGPGCLAEEEVIVLEGTSGKTSLSVVFAGTASNERDVLRRAERRDADGDGWIYEGTDQEMFVGKVSKAGKKFKYDRKVPLQNRVGIASLLTWIPDNWDAAYLIDEPS